MCQAGQYLAQNDLKCQLLANYGCFGPKSYFLGKGAKLLFPTYQKTALAPRLHCFLMKKMCTFVHFFLYLGPKVKNSYHQYTRGYNFPIGPT